MTMMYSKQITKVHQIELTSRCNLACVYCPHPNLDRPKKDIGMVDYAYILNTWVSYFMEKGTQGELSLTGMGESLMHPQFLDTVAMARAVIGDNKLVIATNGILLTREICEFLAPYKPKLYISLHRQEKAAQAVELAREYDMLGSVNAQFIYNAIDWAGQVDWPNSAKISPCADLHVGKISFLSDGRITTCCMDAHGKHTLGYIYLVDPYDFETKQTVLCDTCHHEVPK